MDIILNNYLTLLGNLHRNIRAGTAAPHKPLLLLAIFAEIERGAITDNKVYLTPELVAIFRAYWRVLVQDNTWQERIVYPFRYMIQEKFWELVKDGSVLTTRELADPTSIKQLEAMIDYAQFSSEFWLLLQNTDTLHTLRQHLLKVYFAMNDAQLADQVPDDPLMYEAEKLKAEAQSKFRIRKISEPKEDGYFVRHALFPSVVKNLYGNTCAVCQLTLVIPGGKSIVEATHIMPFSTFHNDDPRNGIALCKNHHWAFDVGGIAIDKDYKIRVSSHLIAPASFVVPNRLILLPYHTTYFPAEEALSWHRSHVFLG